ncbi:MAG: 30S ribosomal protein S17 [Myxococcales bacterium]|jgi:small subunit ribosomal protein S17|nr:MAG: 30S ribosomal protein S17 [Myxococcales bacterium]
MSEPSRVRAKTREGVVVSDAMDKTIVVVVTRLIKHPRYHKYIRVKKKYAAHDERNECNKGDRVVIAECRPLSKSKRWRLRTIVERATLDVPDLRIEEK